jgi:hypothetical protein
MLARSGFVGAWFGPRAIGAGEVADVEAARTELVGRGVDVSPIDEMPWGRLVSFSDPDGNTWSLQEREGG